MPVSNASVFVLFIVYLFSFAQSKEKKYEKERKKERNKDKLKLNNKITSNIGIQCFVKLSCRQTSFDNGHW